MRDVRVGVERDVGDRVPFADEEGLFLQVPLHRLERLDAAAVQETDRLGQLFLLVGEADDEAVDRDRVLVLVLLEEQPAQHVRLQPGIGRPRGACRRERR